MNRRFLRSALSIAFLALSIAAPAAAQSAFRHSRVVFYSDLPAAHDKAVQQHEGDLFVYFYRSGDARHAKMDSLVFSDERLSRYINANFGALAADVDTKIGKQILEIFRPGHVYDSPIIAVMNKRQANTLFFYGWHNGSPALDEYGFDSNGQHWVDLVAMKEFGRASIKPGEDAWGRWSARLMELRAESGEQK